MPIWPGTTTRRRRVPRALGGICQQARIACTPPPPNVRSVGSIDLVRRAHRTLVVGHRMYCTVFLPQNGQASSIRQRRRGRRDVHAPAGAATPLAPPSVRGCQPLSAPHHATAPHHTPGASLWPNDSQQQTTEKEKGGPLSFPLLLEADKSLYKRELDALLDRRLGEERLKVRRERTLKNYRERQKQGQEVGDELNNAYNDYLEAANQLKATNNKIATTRSKIRRINKSIEGLKKIGNEADLTYWDNFKQELEELKYTVKEWEDEYIIYAPIAGKVIQYGESWTSNTFYEKGDPIIGIIRPESANAISQDYFIVEVQIGLQGYGKVKKGQEVILKLNEYPFRQFGVLRGEVLDKSTFKIKDTYAVKVIVSNELKTSFGEIIPPATQMIGRAEIITEDQRFIERILNRFLSIFKNR